MIDTMEPSRKAQLQRAFHLADTDNSGGISRDEIKAFFKKEYNDSPWTYSMTRYTWPGLSIASNSFTTFGWSNLVKILISL